MPPRQQIRTLVLTTPVPAFLLITTGTLVTSIHGMHGAPGLLTADGIPGRVQLRGQRGTTGIHGITGILGTTGMTGILGAIQILGMNGILGTREAHLDHVVL